MQDNVHGLKSQSMLISVIVPVFNVGAFIERCAESLMRQTMEDVEYIFVNDATQDDSIEVLNSVLDRYPKRRDCVQVIAHSQNQGLPASRNDGMAVAQGEYIFHCDGDDYVEPDALESLYECARANDLDIVWCDWYLDTKHGIRRMSQPCYHTPMEALKGILGGAMKYNVWNKLVKKSLYVDNHIGFPVGYGMGEDMTIIMLFASAKSVAHLPIALYHYVKYNASSYCNTYSAAHISELRYNVSRVQTYLLARFGESLRRDMDYFKLEVKFPFLISPEESSYAQWRALYPESNKWAWSNKAICLRRRILQWMAAKGQWWYVRSYYYILHRVGLA